MKKTTFNQGLKGLPEFASSADGVRRWVNCATLDKDDIDVRLSSKVLLNAFTSILVLSGTATLTINYKTYRVHSHSVILLSASHLFCFDQCSDDFRCMCVYVSREFMDEMDSTDMIFKRIKYGVRTYNTPIRPLMPEQLDVLQKRLQALDETIDNKEHLYHKDMILNALFAFYLDVSNVIDREEAFFDDENTVRYEKIIQSFIELLIDHYRTEHHVEFYSSRLNISSHYLTLIVKRTIGQSVNEFIYDMLYSEARALLVHSKLSIQEIATKLNFSDQSSFGKFFKRKSGMSPMEFRR